MAETLFLTKYALATCTHAADCFVGSSEWEVIHTQNVHGVLAPGDSKLIMYVRLLRCSVVLDARALLLRYVLLYANLVDNCACGMFAPAAVVVSTVRPPLILVRFRGSSGTNEKLRQHQPK